MDTAALVPDAVRCGRCNATYEDSAWAPLTLMARCGSSWKSLRQTKRFVKVGSAREELTDTMAITDRTAQMFPRLTSAQIDRISGSGQRRNVRAGEVLFDVGEQNTPLFVVVSGAVAVVRLIGDREEPVGCINRGSSPARSTCCRPDATWIACV